MADKTLKLSQLYGMRAVSTAGRAGYILRVMAEGGAVTGYVCADGNEREFFAAAETALITENGMIVTETEELKGSPLRLGIPLADGEGRLYGAVDELLIRQGKIAFLCCGRKKYPAEGVVLGDIALMLRPIKTLKSSVKKEGRIILKRGTPLSESALERAKKEGEYIQTALKSI